MSTPAPYVPYVARPSCVRCSSPFGRPIQSPSARALSSIEDIEHLHAHHPGICGVGWAQVTVNGAVCDATGCGVSTCTASQPWYLGRSLGSPTCHSSLTVAIGTPVLEKVTVRTCPGAPSLRVNWKLTAPVPSTVIRASNTIFAGQVEVHSLGLATTSTPSTRSAGTEGGGAEGGGDGGAVPGEATWGPGTAAEPPVVAWPPAVAGGAALDAVAGGPGVVGAAAV